MAFMSQFASSESTLSNLRDGKEELDRALQDTDAERRKLALAIPIDAHGDTIEAALQAFSSSITNAQPDSAKVLNEWKRDKLDGILLSDEPDLGAVKIASASSGHPKCRGEMEMTPLHWTCEKDRPQDVELLLEAGADANALDMLAVYAGSEEMSIGPLANDECIVCSSLSFGSNSLFSEFWVYGKSR